MNCNLCTQQRLSDFLPIIIPQSLGVSTRAGVSINNTYIRKYIHTYIYINTYYIYTHIRTYIHTYMYIHTYIRTYVLTYTYIHTYTHTYKRQLIRKHYQFFINFVNTLSFDKIDSYTRESKPA